MTAAARARSVLHRFAGSCGAIVLQAGLVAVLGAPARAAGIGKPEPWQMDLQIPVTEVARDIYNFHHVLNYIIFAITLFVLALIVVIAVRFNERKHPVPSQTTHNSLLEVAWTIVPVLILVGIAIPSFRVLRAQLSDPKADVIVKITGHAWYWEYEYPVDQGGGFKFDANLLEGADLKPGMIRQLSTDNEMVVPVDKIVKVQVTAADVLHSWALPSFGFKIDAIPGRLNQFWFKAEREGVYYGQCSELCGQRHAYMPITVRVVGDQAYAAWLGEAKQKFARTDGGARLADAAPAAH